MSTKPHNVLQQARQGNPDAIAALMNQHLQARRITAQVTQRGNALHISLESAQPTSQGDLVAYIKKGVSGLSLADIHHLNISGKQIGHAAPDWTETIDLISSSEPELLSLDTESNGLDSSPGDNGSEALSNHADLSSLNFNLEAQALNDELEQTQPDTLDDDLGFDLDTSLETTDGSGDDALDLDLGILEDVEANDLDLDLEGNSLDIDDPGIDGTDLEGLDLGLAETAGGASDGFDLNLDADELQNSADELNAALSDLEMATPESDRGHEISSDDLDFDLNFESPATTSDAFDLESDELSLTGDWSATDGEPSTPDLNQTADVFSNSELELGNSEFELDFDSDPDTEFSDGIDLSLDLEEPGDAPEENDLDIDLESSSDFLETSAADFDLDIVDGAEDFSLDLGDSASAADGAEGLPADQESNELGANSLDLTDVGAQWEGETAEPFADGTAVDAALTGESATDAADIDLSFEEIDDFPTAKAGTDAADIDLSFDTEELLDTGAEAGTDAADIDLSFDTEELLDTGNENLDFNTSADAFDLEELEEIDLALDEPHDASTADGADIALEQDNTPSELENLDFELDDFPASEEPSPLELSLEDPSVGDDMTDPQPLSLGEGLEGDLWSGDQTTPVLDHLESESTTNAGEADIDWNPIELDDGKDAGATRCGEEAPHNEWLSSDDDIAFPEVLPSLEDNFAAEAVSVADAEPVDLMLSQELDLSAAEDFQVDAETNIAEEVEDPQPDEKGELENNMALDAPESSNLDLSAATAAAAAAAETIPQSPIHKLLREEEGDPDSVSVTESELLTDVESASSLDLDLTEELSPGDIEPEDFTLVDPISDVNDADLTINDPEALNIEDAQSFTADESWASADELDDTAAFTASTQEADAGPDDTTAFQDIAAPDDFSEPELGLRPEDFPLFENDVDPQASPGNDNSQEFDQPLAQPPGNKPDIDTLELDSAGSVDLNKLNSEDFLIEDELADDGLAATEVAAETADETVGNSRHPAQQDDAFDESFINESFEITDDEAWVDDAQVDDAQSDATDDFVSQLAEGGDEPLSTSVTLTDEDLENLDNGSGGSSTNWLVGLGLGVVCLGLLGILINALLGNRQPTEPVAEPPIEMPVPTEELEEPVAEEPEEPVAEEPEETEPSLEVSAEAQYFREAVNAAQEAANLAQTASTGEEWQTVADSWAKAIDLMKQVPESDSNYATAQQKAIDYQPNLEYAQQNAERF